MWYKIYVIVVASGFAAGGQVFRNLRIPMPELCCNSPGMVIEIFAGDKQIGKYNNSLQGLSGYHNRLQLDCEIGAIVLKNWSPVDSLRFRNTIKTPENRNLPSYDVYYNVTMNGDVVSRIRVIPGRNGSDLHIPVPELCSSRHKIFIDFYIGGNQIGNYDCLLEGLKEYQNRLLYDKKTHVFILKNWTTLDGLGFSAEIKISENDHISSYDVYYNVSINGDSRSIQSTTNITLPSIALLSVAVLFCFCPYC